MKTKLLPLVLICCTFQPVFSQSNLLKINVTGPNVADVTFMRNNAPLLGALVTGDFKIKLDATPANSVVKIELQNMVGAQNTLVIDNNLQDTIRIVDRKLAGFQLSGNFKIKVFLSASVFAELTVNKPTGGTQVSDTPVAPLDDPKIPPPAKAANKVGSMITDAIKLAAPATSLEESLDILAYYAGVKQDWNEVEAAYANNIHLSALATFKKNSLAPGAQASNDKQLNSFLESIGGLDVTTLALGTTDFIIKRAKEELNIAFFKRFQEFITKPEYKDLATLFPSTWQTLSLVGTDIYNYTRYLQMLQNAFKNDIAQLTTNFPLIIDNHPIFFERHPELEASLRSGVYIAQSLRYGVHPGEIIDRYDAELLNKFGTNIAGVGPNNPNFKTAVQIIQLLSFSLRNATDENTAYWIDPEMVRKVFSNRNTAQIFIGLLYQYGAKRFEKLNFKNETGVVEILGELNKPAIFNNLNAWDNYLSMLAVKAKGLNNLIKTYESKNGDSLKIEQLYTYFQASIDLLKYATRVTQLPDLKYPGFEQMFSVYFETAEASASLIVNANRAQYTAAITDAVRIYALVRNKDIDGTAKDLEAKIASAAYTAEQKLEMLAQLSRSNAVGELSKGLFRYGSFMAAVADADSPKEVSDAIEAFALPSGSSRIKRESTFNVSLNAYAGLFGGYERIIGLAADKDFKLNAYGLTVPIGVAVSTSKNHWSYSAFLSLVDLGAVAAFRAQNDSINEVPSIQLKDIFSPGLFFSLGIPKSPISLNLGAQFGPNLRKVTVTDNDYSGSTYMRFSLSVLVDIPLLNFYTKSKD